MRFAASALFLVLSAAAASVEPPPALRVEGVPPVPRELMDELSRYNNTRSATLLSWNPVKREMLIGTRFGEAAQVHRVAAPAGARTQLTFGEERVMSARYDPVSGRRFVFLRDTGGSEFYQLYLYDEDTGKITLLSDGKSRNSTGHWSPDGKLIAHTSTRRNGRDTDIWLADPSNPQNSRMLVQNEGGGWSVEDWSPDSQRLIISRYRSITTASLYEVDLKTGGKRALTPDTEGVSYPSAVYAPDGKRLYVLTNENSEFMRLAVRDLQSGQTKDLLPELKWDVESIELSSDGKLLAYVVNEDGADKIFILNTATGKQAPGPQMPLGSAGVPRFRKGTHELGFSFSSAKTPADAYSFDADNQKLVRWTFSETGGLNPEKFVEPELVRWKSFDGRMISGFLYRPPASFSGKRPVIVNIHGGPEGQSKAGFLSRLNYYMNELGVAIIFPNVRGSAGYGRTFVNLDNGKKREDSVKDIGALLDWIASRPDLDGNRVMVTGGSYGGYMTLASMTHFNDRLCCGVDVVGIANFVTFLENTESYRRDLRRVEYGDERDPSMRDHLLTISPVKNVGKIRKPMMIVQGRNDPRVPWTESKQMVEALQGQNTPVWYLLAADEGHGFAKKSNQDYQFAATVLFVKRHLLGN